MLTFIHSPQSRSTTLLGLIDEMNLRDRITIKTVTIIRQDGSGARDPSNPHPEGKVPALIHDDVVITERSAIILHLTTLFPEAGLAPEVGTPQWGAYVTWLSWYQGVIEPVLLFQFAQIKHPMIDATFRGPSEMAARLHCALEKGPWLLGERFSAADILIHSPFALFPQATPDDPLIRDWVERVAARPAIQKAAQADLSTLRQPT